MGLITRITNFFFTINEGDAVIIASTDNIGEVVQVKGDLYLVQVPYENGSVFTSWHRRKQLIKI